MLTGMLMPLGFELAFLICVGVAIGKEVWDKISGKGAPEIKDAFATIVGGSVTIVWLINFN